MRAREWYSWHFPELFKALPQNIQQAEVVKAILKNAAIRDELLEPLNEILLDKSAAKDVIDSTRSSMGTDISDVDLVNI